MTFATAQEAPTAKRRGRPPKNGKPLLRVLIPVCKSATKTKSTGSARRRPVRRKRVALGTLNKPVVIHQSDSESEDSDDEDFEPSSDIDMGSESRHPVPSSSSRLDSEKPLEDDWEPFFPPKVLVSLDHLSIDCEDGGDDVEEDEGREWDIEEGNAGFDDDNLIDWRDSPGISGVSAFVILSRWDDDSVHSRATNAHKPQSKAPTSASTHNTRSLADSEDLSDVLDVEMLLAPDRSHQESSYSSNTGISSNYSRSSGRSSLALDLSDKVLGNPQDSSWLSSGTNTPRRCLSPDGSYDTLALSGASEPPSSPSSESGESTSSAFTLSSPLPPFRFQRRNAFVRATAMRRAASAPAVCAIAEPTPLLHQLVRLALECPLPGCPESFGENSLKEFEQHFQLKHSSRAAQMPCPCIDACGRPHGVRLHEGDMGRHIWKSHMDVVGFVCRGCESRTSTAPDIVAHISGCETLTKKYRANTIG